jgi:hypothetical protein
MTQQSRPFAPRCVPAFVVLFSMCQTGVARTDVNWLNPVSGTWSGAANWSTGSVPNNGSPSGASYDVILNAVGAPYTVTNNSPSITVNSILINSPDAELDSGPGTLRAPAGISVVAGQFWLAAANLDAAKLIGTTVTGSGGFVGFAYGSLIDGVTLNADATVSAQGALTIQNSLTMGAGRTLTILAPTSGQTNVRFLGGTQTLNGGTVVFDGAASDNRINFNTAGVPLTIGPTTTIRTGTAAATIGNTSVAFTNQGTISAETPSRTLTVRGLNLQNQGLLKASNNGLLAVGGTITAGGLGTISATNGGRIYLTGTLNNTGNTTLLDGPEKQLQLSLNSLDGQVVGGTLATANGGAFLIGGGVPRLSNVTLDTDFDIPGGRTVQLTGNSLAIAAGRSLRMLGGLNDGTATLSFTAAGSNTLSGPGDIAFGGTPGGTTAAYNIISGPSGSTLTLAPNLTIRTDTDGGIIGNSGVTLVNKGTIISTVGSRAITIRGTNWRNEGVIQLDGGGLTLEGTMAPGGLGTVTGSGVSDILLNTSATFDNTGQEIELGGDSPVRIRLRGTFQGGTVLINDNDPAARGGDRLIGYSWSGFVTGKDENGKWKELAMIGTSPSGLVRPTPRAERSSIPVVIDDRAAIYLDSSASIHVEGGLTLGDTTAVLDGIQGRGLFFDGTQTLAAAEGRIAGGGTTGVARGTVLFQGVVPQGIHVSAGTLTVGQGICMITGTGGGEFSLGGSTGLINNGLISARTPGLKVDFLGSGSAPLVIGPTGVLEATNGGTVRVGLIASQTPAFTNNGTLRVGVNGLVTRPASMTMSSAGRTVFEFGGRAANQYGRITITGTTALAGALQCELTPGYAPVWGDVWTVLTSTVAVTGGFASVGGDPLPNPNLRWWSDVSGNSVRVGVAHFADINHDGAVNTIDLTTFLGQFGSLGTGLSGDFNADGAVNTIDLTAFLGSFGLTAS